MIYLSITAPLQIFKYSFPSVHFMFYCSPCSLNRQPSWSQFPRIKLICIHQLIVNSSFLFFRSDPLPGWEISFLFFLLRFLRPSGRLGVFVGNSYLCIGGYTQNATPTGRLGSCNLRGFYRCLGLQKKDTYVILATTQTTYPLHPQLLIPTPSTAQQNTTLKMVPRRPPTFLYPHYNGN